MSDSEGKEYEVEAIVNDRERKDHYDRRARKWIYIKEYLIKWVGYKKGSWEPEENLDNCSKLLNEYKRKKNKSNAAAKNTKANVNTVIHKSRTPLKLGSNRRKINTNNNNYNNYNKNKKPKEKEEAKEEQNEEQSKGKEEIKEQENELDIKDVNNFFNNNINNNTNNGLVIPNFLEEEGDENFPMNNYNSYFYPQIFNRDNDYMSNGESSIKKMEQYKSKVFNNLSELYTPMENDFDLDKYFLSYNNNNNINNINNNNDLNNNNNDSNYYNIDVLKPFGERMLEIEKEEEKDNLRNNLLQKKRKINSLDISDNSSISISIDDPFIKNEKESLSFINTNDNSNSNSISNNLNINNNDNIEILEVFVPEKNEDQMNLLCLNKENGTPFYASIKDSFIPAKVKINCLERILRRFLKGKTIKINQLGN